MAVFLSLQGGMAAGKTTAARYVSAHRPDVYISYENHAPVIEQIRRRGLSQNSPEGFAEIQRLFIRAEIERYEACKDNRIALFDLGPEEIEFFTLHYPTSIGADWDVEAMLGPELASLRACRLDGILYLDAGVDTLREHKEADPTRGRGSFDHQAGVMLPYKKAWFASRANPVVDFLVVDLLSKQQVGQSVLEWVEKHACE